MKGRPRRSNFRQVPLAVKLGAEPAGARRPCQDLRQGRGKARSAHRRGTGLGWAGERGDQETVKAIETVYKGYRFRSRLEARWAVFFDALGVEYEYEKEGYELPSGRYLPDFWLPEQNAWFEIKPTAPSDIEQQRCFELADQSGYSAVIIIGQPHAEYDALNECNWPKFSLRTYHGWRIPDAKFFEYDNWWLGLAFFEKAGLYELLKRHGYQLSPPPAKTREQILAYVEADQAYYKARYGRDHPNYRFGLCGKEVMFDIVHRRFALGPVSFVDSTITKALASARAARFEFGETPTFSGSTEALSE